MSIHNGAFDTYDEILEPKPPANDPRDEGPPPYNQIQRKYSDNPPDYLEQTRGDQPPPVPNTRRPSAFEGPRQRSRTDPPPPCDFNNRGVHANYSDTEPEERPLGHGPRKHSVVSLPEVRSRKMSVFDQRLPLQSERDEHPTVYVPRKRSVPSLTRAASRADISPEDQPPPLVPRMPQSSKGNINTENSPERGRHVYSNFASVIPEVEEGPLASLSDNDDTDAHGYVTFN